MRKLNLLVAEDDAHIRLGLVDALESEQYRVEPAVDGEHALRLWRKGTFDLVILDIMMPQINGYDVCRHIRKSNTQVPILMLSAKTEEIDKVLGLELGADDYISKPFGIRELLARVAAALRRSQLHRNDQTGQSLPDSLDLNAYAQVDRKQYKLITDEKEEPLTAREVALLEIFYQHPNEALSRDFLLNKVWGYEYTGTTRTLDQHILQLRKKLQQASHPPIIETVHSVGYRYCR